MNRSVRRFATLVTIVCLAGAACTEPIRTEVFVDEAASLTFAGREYLGVWGELFEIDRATLTEVGTADRINVPNSDGTVYHLAGLDPGTVLVTRHGDGSFSVFVRADLVRPSAPPLGHAVPALCRWFKELPAECGGSPSPSR